MAYTQKTEWGGRDSERAEWAVAEMKKALKDRAELIDALREAAKQAETVWQEANGLRDSKAAGSFARHARALLSRLGAE